jgi:uncharacterized protein with HEPN domain
MKSDRVYIQHILDEIQFLEENFSSLTFDDFIESPILKKASERSVSIIGEASKKISSDFKNQNSNIQWNAIAGTRNRLIHDYLGVDYEILWDVIKNKILNLKTDLQGLI